MFLLSLRAMLCRYADISLIEKTPDGVNADCDNPNW